LIFSPKNFFDAAREFIPAQWCDIIDSSVNLIILKNFDYEYPHVMK